GITTSVPGGSNPRLCCGYPGRGGLCRGQWTTDRHLESRGSRCALTLCGWDRIIGVMSESKGVQINWLGASGSALGAVTSAVLLSTLGAAGTPLGAALASLSITVEGVVYTYFLDRAKSGIEKTAEMIKYSRRSNKTASENIAPISATSYRRNMEDLTQTASMKATGEEPE